MLNKERKAGRRKVSENERASLFRYLENALIRPVRSAWIQVSHVQFFDFFPHLKHGLQSLEIVLSYTFLIVVDEIAIQKNT